MRLSIDIDRLGSWNLVEQAIRTGAYHGLYGAGVQVINRWAGSVPKQTGHTSRSGTVAMGRGLEVRFGSNQVSAKVLEHGARPHTIRPRRRKVLSWKSQGGGSIYRWKKTKALPGTGKSGRRKERTSTVKERRRVARYVDHPGVSAGHYLELATEGSIGEMKKIIANSIQGALR